MSDDQLAELDAKIDAMESKILLRLNELADATAANTERIRSLRAGQGDVCQALQMTSAMRNVAYAAKLEIDRQREQPQTGAYPVVDASKPPRRDDSLAFRVTDSNAWDARISEKGRKQVIAAGIAAAGALGALLHWLAGVIMKATGH